MENQKAIEQYFKDATNKTEIGEHLFILNLFLQEIVKNTAPDIIHNEVKPLATPKGTKEN